MVPCVELEAEAAEEDEEEEVDETAEEEDADAGPCGAFGLAPAPASDSSSKAARDRISSRMACSLTPETPLMSSRASRGHDTAMSRMVRVATAGDQASCRVWTRPPTLCRKAASKSEGTCRWPSPSMCSLVPLLASALSTHCCPMAGIPDSTRLFS